MTYLEKVYKHIFRLVTKAPNLQTLKHVPGYFKDHDINGINVLENTTVTYNTVKQ